MASVLGSVLSPTDKAAGSSGDSWSNTTAIHTSDPTSGRNESRVTTETTHDSNMGVATWASVATCVGVVVLGGVWVFTQWRKRRTLRYLGRLENPDGATAVQQRSRRMPSVERILAIPGFPVLIGGFGTHCETALCSFEGIERLGVGGEGCWVFVGLDAPVLLPPAPGTSKCTTGWWICSHLILVQAVLHVTDVPSFCIFILLSFEIDHMIPQALCISFPTGGSILG
ncbi:hypothetical protein PENSTE_c030G09199 [Penicillium steckii]|uniref:Uncharacterized protein n=1 Tax=Penicillium steckii TaxID=303698 RepID=A0A1V6SMB5_9EURO|nr:hypothetical protein PENSTE_c030G09199 [Penicillium steckii]